MATAADEIAREIAALRGTKPATFGQLVRHPSFSRLWRAMLVSSLGDWIGFVAVTTLVARIGVGNAGFAVSGVMLARMLPAIIFGPFAGVFVDRFDRKRLMIVADIGRGAMYASMPFLPNLAAIYALSFLIECLSLVWTPAKDATLPNLVPRRQLVNANTVGLVTSYGTLPLGGILFTAVAAVAGVFGRRTYLHQNPEALALWLDGATFLFSAYMVRGLVPRQAAPSKRGRLKAGQAFADIVEGVRFLREQPFVRAMTIGIVMAFTAVGSVIAIGPIFATSTLHAGPAGWGVLVTSVGVGMAVGMPGVNWAARFAEKDTLFPLALLAAAGSLALLAAMPSIELAGFLTAVMGAAAGATWVMGYSLLQENIADRYRGRTFATLTVLARFGLFLSLAGFPALAQIVGTRHIGGVAIAGTRQALWIGALIGFAGGFLARRGLKRSRLLRPRALHLVPRLRKVERRGAFIVFEGVEGSGKGTQIRMAREYLETQGHRVLVTREPGGTDLGERVRDAVLDKGGAVEPRAEALLFAASRAQHVASVIRPALEDGKVVLCDRYVDSSLAYQGVGRGLGEADVLSLNVWATQGLFPDLVILLTVEPAEGLARASGAGAEEGEAGPDADRIEAEGELFLSRVAEAYLHIAEEHPERFVVIDASVPADRVHGRVREALDRYFAREDR